MKYYKISLINIIYKIISLHYTVFSVLYNSILHSILFYTVNIMFCTVKISRKKITLFEKIS